jgi:carboxypeptidase Q
VRLHSPSRATFARGLAAVALLVAVPATAQESVDAAAINRIKSEGYGHSQVMDIASWLTDVYGARLTGSPNARDAGDWAVKKMTEWGAVGATLEPWGPFGRGWSNEYTAVSVIAPRPFPVVAYPSAWTPGTKGMVKGEAILAVVSSPADFDQWRGKLRGKVVLASPSRLIEPHFAADAHRLTDDELAKMEQAPVPQPGGGRRGPGAGQPNFQEQLRQRQQDAAAVADFLVKEGVLAVVTSGRGDDGTVFVGGGGSRDPATPTLTPALVFEAEHYGRIARMLEKGIPVTLQLDVRNRFQDADLNSFNVVAELPGTDPQLRDEVVMLGAHFDSWHTGTGATDNAAGSAVMMEALRILKASGVSLKRTVRIALWTGEEEGLLGSRAYVKAHFGDPQTMKLTAAQPKLAGYFNVDNGTGRIRGVYLQGNTAVAPIFRAWMVPFADSGMTALTPANTGGTDHLSFDALGMPGFQFIQDPMDYGTRTHHSNQDVWERLQAGDMIHNAVVVASFVYLTANRPEPLPRKPLPDARTVQ